MSYDLECPYCGRELEVCHDDGFGYEEGVLHQMECDYCEKNFTFNTSISFYYESYKADCLNGEPHDFKPTKTWPIEATKMRCQTCESEREPLASEWALIKTPPPQSEG